MNNKYIQKQIKKGLFLNAYHQISDDFSFNLDNIVSCFPKLNSKDIYLFLMVAISKNETVEKYISICDDLLYIDPYINGSLSLISWHMRTALKSFPNSTTLKHWIIDTFWENPDSPFIISEIKQYAMDILNENPNDEYAQSVIKEST